MNTIKDQYLTHHQSVLRSTKYTKKSMPYKIKKLIRKSHLLQPLTNKDLCYQVFHHLLTIAMIFLYKLPNHERKYSIQIKIKMNNIFLNLVITLFKVSLTLLQSIKCPHKLQVTRKAVDKDNNNQSTSIWVSMKVNQQNSNIISAKQNSFPWSLKWSNLWRYSSNSPKKCKRMKIWSLSFFNIVKSTKFSIKYLIKYMEKNKDQHGGKIYWKKWRDFGKKWKIQLKDRFENDNLWLYNTQKS